MNIDLFLVSTTVDWVNLWTLAWFASSRPAAAVEVIDVVFFSQVTDVGQVGLISNTWRWVLLFFENIIDGNNVLAVSVTVADVWSTLSSISGLVEVFAEFNTGNAELSKVNSASSGKAFF